VKVGRYLLVFVVLMAVVIAFGNRGLMDNYRMRQKLDTIDKGNAEIVRVNGELKRTILLLREDPAYIERVARDELGMVKPGDLVYRFAQ